MSVQEITVQDDSDFRPIGCAIAPDGSLWTSLLSEKEDLATGRRFFFSQLGSRCAHCHRHSGRGGLIGPDLSRIAESNTRKKIITSMLLPDRDIAPSYQSWVLQTQEGKTFSALKLHKSGNGGKEFYSDSEGKVFKLDSQEIEYREPSQISIMPQGSLSGQARGGAGIACAGMPLSRWMTIA